MRLFNKIQFSPSLRFLPLPVGSTRLFKTNKQASPSFSIPSMQNHHSTSNIPHITGRDIPNNISIQEIIEVQRKVFLQFNKKTKDDIKMPLRTNIITQYGSTLFMPAYVPHSGFGLKVVSIRPDNEQKGLPTLPALILLFDPVTGLPQALIDASYLTSLRTAAASAVATKYLSNYVAKKLAVFGSGPVAECHVHAIMAVRGEHLKKIVIWNRTHEKGEKLVEKLKKDGRLAGIEITTERSPDAAVIDADIIVTATSSNKPLFDGKNIKEGAHINCVGSFLPSMIEVDACTVKRSLVVVDTVEAALEEAGDLLQPLKQGIVGRSHILAELSEIIDREEEDIGGGGEGGEGGEGGGRGGGQLACRSSTDGSDFPVNSRAKQIRRSKQDITLFKSCGLAIQDIAAASEIYRKFTLKSNL